MFVVDAIRDPAIAQMRQERIGICRPSRHLNHKTCTEIPLPEGAAQRRKIPQVHRRATVIVNRQPQFAQRPPLQHNPALLADNGQ